MTLEPIGYLRTCFGSKFAVPRQPGLCPSAWGELRFAAPFRKVEAVRGLDGFSHLWLVFGFHETVAEGWNPTVRPPRLGGNERVGVFASRSTYRPNGLGLSLVKLERIALEEEGGIEPPVLHVSGVDVVDGTPVYDVKPYLPYAESLPEARAGYAEEGIPRLRVEVDEAARSHFDRLEPRLRQVVFEALQLDPRPAASPRDESRVYGALLGGRDVKFTVAEGICRVVGVD